MPPHVRIGVHPGEALADHSGRYWREVGWRGERRAAPAVRPSPTAGDGSSGHRQAGAPAFDAGVPLRGVEEAASHADPRITMRYDRARQSQDRHAAYIVAAFVAGASR